nr:alpha-glucan phosphorylase, h isozyme [Quercus suber]
MRKGLDGMKLGISQEVALCFMTVAYTNHTVLPEVLEKWSQVVMWKLLRRYMEIIEEIDKRFIAMIHKARPDLESKLPRMRILDNNPRKPVVRMVNLCVVSAHTVRDNVSPWPTKFQNKTNGITPCRWLRFCSPDFSSIITKWLKTEEWITNLDLLTGLRQFADNAELQAEWASAKMANKQRLAEYIERATGVVFVPNYNVSVAEILIPGSELSQHISTAGMEASGTSNMKFALNGCLIIGTLDGANVEIREEIGDENFFLFGATADEVPRLRKKRENGEFKPDPRFEKAKEFIRSGAFGSYDFNPLLDSLEGNSGYGHGHFTLFTWKET